ncbi:MAG: hypothetical protein M3421_09265 [Bacteroidota bacterium]|nr:hypothetical protein [Bacteroidota bacterium]
MNKFIFYVLFLCIPLIQSCDNTDDQIPAGEYERGVIIVNEGNFSASDASISFLNQTNNQVENNVFNKVNDRPIGSVLQSIYFHDGRGYLVVNNSNKVEIVAEETFVSTGVIEEGLANPRYFVASGSKGYVSNWGSFDENFQLDQSYVAIVDINNLAVIKKINTENGTEHIAISGNKLFASNNFTNTVSVIDLTSESVEATITLSSSPNGIAIDMQGRIWIICQGSYQGNDGKLFAIDPTNYSILKEIDLNINTAGHLIINGARDRLYFSTGKSIYEMAVTADEAPASALIRNEDMAGGVYGLGIDPISNVIYASDAVLFGGNGRVYRYDVSGTPIDNFSVGIGPNGFWFK